MARSINIIPFDKTLSVLSNIILFNPIPQILSGQHYFVWSAYSPSQHHSVWQKFYIYWLILFHLISWHCSIQPTLITATLFCLAYTLLNQHHSIQLVDIILLDFISQSESKPAKLLRIEPALHAIEKIKSSKPAQSHQ